MRRCLPGHVRRVSVSASRRTVPWRTAASASATPVTRSNLDAHTACITLSNPARRNALSSHTLSLLKDAVASVRASKEARVLLIRAEGPVFCSGHDLKELLAFNEEQRRKCFEVSADIMKSLQELPVPVVAEVGALATAAGAQLVASCDVVIASSQASFSTPGVKIGLFCSTPAVAISRSLNSSRKALEMLLTGDVMSAQEALQCGLVNRVVSPEQLGEATMTFIGRLLQNSAPVIALGKRAFYEQPLDQAYKTAVKAMVDNLCRIDDAREGVTAFVEKKKPQWKHK